ncbi:MAG: hypothetical protein ACP5OG_04250 [Candidatus Nanoarchaeia archaeon]
MKEKIIEDLKETIKRTGYVSEIEIFEGEYREDKKNKEPYVSYVLDMNNKKRDTMLHKLEREIRAGFFNKYYDDCKISTSIEEISPTEEKHTLVINFDHEKKEKRQRQLYKAANQLIKIINEYHLKHRG